MIFRRPKLDASIQNHFRRAAELFSDVPKRNTELLFESHLPFENWGRPGHSCSGKQRRINAAPCGVSECNAFPMREFACTRLAHRSARDASNIHGVSRFFRIKFHQARARERCGERAVRHMIPATRADTRGIAKSALHFVSKRDRGNQFAAACTHAFRRSQRRGNIIARMCRLFRQIRIVVIEIADSAAVRECGPVRRCLVIRADDCRSVFRRKIGSDFSRNDARLFVPRAQCATQRVNHAPFHFVHDFFGKILKPKRGRIIGELMSKRCLHGKLQFQSADEFVRGNPTPRRSESNPVRLASFAQHKLRRVENPAALLNGFITGLPG